MDCSCFTLLLGYSVTISISFTILVGLYASCGSTQETQEIVSGNQEKNVVEKYDILSFDNSEMTDKAAETCNCFEAIGFTLLEMLVMVILAFGVIVGLFRMCSYLKKKIMKKQEARRTSKQQKELEMRRKIENEILRTVAMSADCGGTGQVTDNACADKNKEKLEFP